MKKNLMTLAAVLCCMISTTVLTSCMDKVDNPVPQEPTMIDPVADIYLHDEMFALATRSIILPLAAGSRVMTRRM